MKIYYPSTLPKETSSAKRGINEDGVDGHAPSHHGGQVLHASLSSPHLRHTHNINKSIIIFDNFCKFRISG